MSPIAIAVSSASSRAAGRPASSSQTSGQTSSAPTQGCAPSRVRMSIRSTHSRAPATSAATRSRPAAASVSTVRLWTASLWRSSSSAGAKASLISAIRAASRPSERFGTARAMAAQTPTSSSPARTIGSPSTLNVGSSTTQSRWTGTETVPPIAAEAPKATWQVPRIFSSSSRLPVSSARSLVPIPSSATLVPSSPCALEQLDQPRPLRAARRGQVPGLDLEHERLRHAADRGDRPVDDQAALGAALDRGDEALAAGQVPERTRRGQVAGVRDPLAVPEPEPQVASRARR